MEWRGNPTKRKCNIDKMIIKKQKYMKTKKQTIGVAVMLLSASIVNAQDIHFTQAQYFPLNLNPAWSGSYYDLSAYSIYRNQWKSVADPFKTIGLSVDGRLKRSKQGHIMAGGIKFYNDNTGDLQYKTNDVSLNLAYQLNLQQGHKLGVGIYGGIIQKSINLGNAKWMSQYDAGTGKYNPGNPSMESFSGTNILVVDAGAGIMYSYAKKERYMRGNQQKRWNIGLAAYHVNRPYVSFLKDEKDRMYVRYVLYGNADIGIPNSNVCIVPLLVYQMQGSQRELLMGGYLKYILQDESKYTGLKKGSSFSIGSIYRNRDAVSLNFVLEYDKYAVGASYDVNVSGLKSVSKGQGAMEVFLRYVFPNPFAAGSTRSRLD